MTRLADFLRTLGAEGVEFILAGEVAAAAHGSARVTQLVDVVYSRESGNLRNLVAALKPLNPYLRGAPPGLPFRFDFETLYAGFNFTLTTDLGWIDLLGEIAGGGRYQDLVGHAITVAAFGVHCRVQDLESLIRTNRAAGRPRDLEAIAELELLRRRTRV